MAVEQKLEIDGEVTEALPNLLFRVKLENDHELPAHLAGKMRRFRIRVLPGDKVLGRGLSVRLNRGRIVYRCAGRRRYTAPLIAALRPLASAATSGRAGTSPRPAQLPCAGPHRPSRPCRSHGRPACAPRRAARRMALTTFRSEPLASAAAWPAPARLSRWPPRRLTTIAPWTGCPRTRDRRAREHREHTAATAASFIWIWFIRMSIIRMTSRAYKRRTRGTNGLTADHTRGRRVKHSVRCGGRGYVCPQTAPSRRFPACELGRGALAVSAAEPWTRARAETPRMTCSAGTGSPARSARQRRERQRPQALRVHARPSSAAARARGRSPGRRSRRPTGPPGSRTPRSRAAMYRPPARMSSSQNTAVTSSSSIAAAAVFAPSKVKGGDGRNGAQAGRDAGRAQVEGRGVEVRGHVADLGVAEREQVVEGVVHARFDVEAHDRELAARAHLDLDGVLARAGREVGLEEEQAVGGTGEQASTEAASQARLLPMSTSTTV